MEKIAIAILAAGKGSRFAGDCPKPLALLCGRSLLHYALSAAIDSGLHPVLLVAGCHYEEIAAAAEPGVQVVFNPYWHEGIASSLQTALRAIEPDPSVAAVCIGLADQPFVGAEAYRRLAAACFQGATLAAATYGGARRNPVLLHRSLWDKAMQLQGDAGAKQLMEIYPVVEVDCDGTGSPLDVDTAEDLRELETLNLT